MSNRAESDAYEIDIDSFWSWWKLLAFRLTPKPRGFFL
jgi:hypothetical protein